MIRLLGRPCTPMVPPIRSHGCRAEIHCPDPTFRMRWRSFREVAALSCQIGARIPITSALDTSEIGISPMRGTA